MKPYAHHWDLWLSFLSHFTYELEKNEGEEIFSDCYTFIAPPLDKMTPLKCKFEGAQISEYVAHVKHWQDQRIKHMCPARQRRLFCSQRGCVIFRPDGL